MVTSFIQVLSKLVLWLFLYIAFSLTGYGEPWLGTRFAQNCAGCHAPGRKNLPPVLRRCTLSCQGCHVNPNGGGLRSFYGKWNENFWLRSYRSKKLQQPKLAAPLHKQFYGRSRKSSAIVKNIKKIIRQGFPLVRSKNEFENELLYDRYHDKYHQTNARSRREFEFSIPQTDPYRQMDEQRIDGGADIRFLAFQQNGGNDSNFHPFLMEATFGLRYRPLRHTHLVYEARYAGPPVGQTIDGIPGKEKTRSIYLMQDDLPWNIFAMGGYYKPLFGNYTPDHTALAQEMTAQALGLNVNMSQALYKAISLGAAPNVPFGNLHYIIKRIDAQPVEESGIAGNFGLRFVTLGAQINYSFWSTTDNTDNNNEIKVEMHAFELRGRLREYIVGIEFVSFSRDEELSDFREGGVVTLEGKYKISKENYITAAYAQSNVSRNILPGTASQMRVGSRHFLYPGLDLSTQYSIDKDRQDQVSAGQSPDNNITTISFMVHTYF